MKKWIRKIKEHGFKGSFISLFRRFHSVMLELEYTNKVEISSKNDTEYSFRLAELRDFDQMGHAYPDEVSKTKIEGLKRRIQTSSYPVYLIIRNSSYDICGYYCIAYKDVSNLPNRYTMKVLDNTAYFLDDYTFMKYRNLGLHTHSIKERLIISLEEKSHIKVHVLKHNKISLQNYQKVGFKVVKKIHFYRVGKWITKFEITV